MSPPSPEMFEGGVTGVAISSTVVVGLPCGVAASSVRVVVRVGAPRRRVRGGLPPLATGDTGKTGPVVLTLLVTD